MSPWILVTLCTAVAFWLRTANRFPQVFGTPGLVNFTETDAWFHVRTIEHFALNFPHRLTLDPYSRIDGGQTVDTGLFFDLPVAFVSWLLHLSPPRIHELAAWYPALLGTLIVPFTFLCGRALLNEKAGLWAAATVATLPGHFLHTGSLGFTDHHVMEALLTTVLLWLLARGTHPLWLGLTLAAYLLTFPGGAFLVLLIVLWHWLEAVRTPAAPPDPRPFAIACLIAAPFAFWQSHVYLMRYSLAALLLGAAFLWVLPTLSRWCARQTHPRAVLLGATALTSAAGFLVVSQMSGAESLMAVIGRLTASNPLAATVAELQPLTGPRGAFSLAEPWRQLGGAFLFIIMALPLLAEAVWRRPHPKLTLLLLWSTLFFVMAMTQIRMLYYLGPSAALLAAYLMSQLRARPLALALLGTVLILPNLTRAINDTETLPGQVSPDWLAALTYLREKTPEPFGDPRLPPAYSILAWWDQGYWLSTIARRVPVTNPTQNNASAAADFFLATELPAARAALQQSRAAYIVVNRQLPFIPDEQTLRGHFLSLFPYSRLYRAEDYLRDVEITEAGHTRRAVFFRPAYFRSMLFRLYFAGGEAKTVDGIGNYAVIRVDGHRVQPLQQLTSLAAARAAAAACTSCELVSENPLTSMVDLDAVPFVEPAFASPTTAALWQGSRRAQVQIYRVR